MSNFTNAPALLEALEQLDRLRADPELMELDRQRRLATIDQMAIDAAKAEGQVRAIITLMNRKYSVVPQEVQMKLFAVRDIEQLDQLMALAYDCNSLEEFASHLR